jgi:hypothetical protein
MTRSPRTVTRAAAAAGLALAGSLALAACGSSSPSASSTTTTTTPVALKLTVTAPLNASLLVAGAKSHDLPTKDFTGLTTGKTYYAHFDGKYWAGAQLVPSTKSQQAQVSVQDDGAYTLLTRTSGGTWVGYNDGLGGATGSTCAVVVPSQVRTVWAWSLTTPCGIAPGV